MNDDQPLSPAEQFEALANLVRALEDRILLLENREMILTDTVTALLDRIEALESQPQRSGIVPAAVVAVDPERMHTLRDTPVPTPHDIPKGILRLT